MDEPTFGLACRCGGVQDCKYCGGRGYIPFEDTEVKVIHGDDGEREGKVQAVFYAKAAPSITITWDHLPPKKTRALLRVLGFGLESWWDRLLRRRIGRS